MENFVVSARKYRPATFDSVIGQAPITTTLKNAIKNEHLAQSFLFCGPRGVGKTTCARILAKTINCENISDDVVACNKCESCTSFNQSHSFNIHELDAASNNGVDDIRNLIEQVRIPPQIGKYSVYIIDEVHMLSAGAFNAFLKTLEEPPSHVKFILATTSKQKIIPTILSRCQIFDFSRIRVRDIAKHLEFVAQKEGVTAKSDALHIIAQKADGSLRDALSIFDQLVSFAGNNITYETAIENLNVLDYDYYFKITRSVLRKDISDCLLTFNEIQNKGFDGHNFITGAGEHFRNLLVCKDTSTLELLQVGSTIQDKYKEQSAECSQEFLLSALNIVNKCDVEYKASINAGLHVELCLMRLCSMDSYFYITQKKEDTTRSTAPAPPNPPAGGESSRFEYPIKSPGGESKQQVAEPDIKQSAVVNQKSEVRSQKSEVGSRQSNTSLEQEANQKLKTRTISIGGPPKAEQPAVTQADRTGDREGLNSEQLEKAWIEYAKKVHKKGKYSLYSTLTKRKPVLSSNEIKFTIDNTVQEDEINAEKTELLGFLRTELNISGISIKTDIHKDEGEKKPYTAYEKFKRLSEKNPAIQKLKQQLDLDIDV